MRVRLRKGERNNNQGHVPESYEDAQAERAVRWRGEAMAMATAMAMAMAMATATAMAIASNKKTEGKEKATELEDNLTPQRARIRLLNGRARGKAHENKERENGPFDEVRREDIYMQSRHYDTQVFYGRRCVS